MKRPEKPGIRKPRRKITEKYLRNAAYAYLGRFNNSQQGLREVLWRKIRRHAARGTEIPNDIDDMLDRVVKTCVEYGFVDDQAYAESRARQDILSGKGKRLVYMRLKQKGIDPETAEKAFASVRDELVDDPENGENIDQLAAEALARRRHIGPYRREKLPEDREGRQKILRREMAAFARAGIPYPIAKSLIDQEVD